MAYSLKYCGGLQEEGLLHLFPDALEQHDLGGQEVVLQLIQYQVMGSHWTVVQFLTSLAEMLLDVSLLLSISPLPSNFPLYLLSPLVSLD